MIRQRLFLTLGVMQCLLFGCDEVTGSLDLQLDRPSGIAVIDEAGWVVVGQDNGTAATFIELDPENGVAQQLMSPAFYLPLKWSTMAESRSWTSAPGGGALYVSGLTGAIEFLDFREIQAGASVDVASTRSDDLFRTAVGTMALSREE